MSQMTSDVKALNAMEKVSTLVAIWASHACGVSACDLLGEKWDAFAPRW